MVNLLHELKAVHLQGGREVLRDEAEEVAAQVEVH